MRDNLKLVLILLLITFVVSLGGEETSENRSEASPLKDQTILDLMEEEQESEKELIDMSVDEILSTPITVAAKKEESPLSASGTVYVITEKDIATYGWRDLKEILSAIPNLDISWQWYWLNGGQRGFSGSFNGTLLLIDGREVQNLLSGEAFITNQFPAHRIKRVEILQGPNSTLYGGNATQGVINIITKSGDQEKRDLSEIEVIYGEAETEQVAAVFKKNLGDIEIGFSGSYFRSAQNYDGLSEFARDNDLYSRQSYEEYKEREPGFGKIVDGKYYDYFRNDEKAWTFDLYAKYNFLYAGFNSADQVAVIAEIKICSKLD